MKRSVRHWKLGIAAVAIVTMTSAYATPTMVQADYHEECLSEGCRNEEVRELYSSFQSECLDEGCWREEVRELAGGGDDRISAMFDHFRSLGYDVPYIAYLGDETNDWLAFVCWISGETPGSGRECSTPNVETPPVNW